MPHRRAVTLLIAGLLGVGVAVFAWPRWQARRALADIVSPSATERARGWKWLARTPDPDGESRLHSRHEQVLHRVRQADDAAVRDAADAMRRLDAWSWTSCPTPIVWRELELRARSDHPDVTRSAAEDLASTPTDEGEIPLDRVTAVVETLLGAAPADVRTVGVESFTAWLGPRRLERLDALPIPDGDHHLLRMRDLAFLAQPGSSIPFAANLPESLPVDVLEARLLRSSFGATGRPEPVLDRLGGVDALPDPPAVDYVLRHSPDPRARAALERRAESGIRSARYALHARGASADASPARRIARDPEQPPTTRRVAAWRWTGIPRDLLAEILALPPAEEDGSVYAAALLAERHLERGEAIAQADRWIRSFNDDEKRAGALLTALLDAPPATLVAARDLEDVPEVRTIQTLALWALGHDDDATSLRELAFRTVHTVDGDFAPDTALCMLRAGERDALPLITSAPRASRQSIQQRAWLIERFVPGWFARLGRPISGNPRAIRLHFDALDAMRHVERLHLGFDATRGIFEME